MYYGTNKGRFVCQITVLVFTPNETFLGQFLKHQKFHLITEVMEIIKNFKKKKKKKKKKKISWALEIYFHFIH